MHNIPATSPYGFQGRLSAAFPSQIIADVTEQCNLACIHCSHSKFKHSPAYTGCHMDATVHHKMVQEVATAGQGHVQYIRYTALGEPLLHPQIFEFLSLAKAKSGATISLTTNGTLLDANNILKLFNTGVDLVDISLDAFSAKAYASIRRGGNHAKTYAQVQNFLAERNRKQLPLKIAVSFIEQDNNLGETEEFKQYWESAGVDYVIIRRLHSNAGAKTDIAKQLQANSQILQRKPCLYPWERIIVRPSGQLEFCPANWDHNTDFANFNKTTLAEVWQGKYMQGLRKAHLNNAFTKYPLCQNCPDWMQTRWPHEGRSFANLVEDIKIVTAKER